MPTQKPDGASPSASGVSDIVSLTERMLTAAEVGNWIEVAELERRRQERLAEHPFAAVSPERAEQAELLVELTRLNERIVQLVADARDRSLSRLHELSQGRHAKRAYGAHTSD